MGRVREKNGWMKEEKWRERGRRRDQPSLQSCSASATVFNPHKQIYLYIHSPLDGVWFILH